MSATAARPRPITRLSRRLFDWWAWRKLRPDIEDQPSIDPTERHAAWLEAMSEWEARRP